MPLDIVEEDFQWVATQLTGEAGPSGTDTPAFHSWLLSFGTSSASVSEDMAAWTGWLANESPPWAAYRNIMAVRMVALEKFPGVRPVGIGEVCCRLVVKLFLQDKGVQAKEAYGSFNLCAGLEEIIEGAIYTLR